MLGSLEFCASKLGLKLILVLGHTQCGALIGAAEAYLNHEKQANDTPTALEGLLNSLSTVSKRTAKMLSGTLDASQLAEQSVKVNVFHSIDFMLKCLSKSRWDLDFLVDHGANHMYAPYVSILCFSIENRSCDTCFQRSLKVNTCKYHLFII